MNKDDPPTSFGVFKPAGHILISFSNANQLQSATDLLLAQGLEVAELTHYSPKEMIAQVDQELLNANPLASLGHEQDFILAHRTMAEAGSHFLVVHAEGDELVEKVAHIARTSHAQRAQRYGPLVIEEIIDQPRGAEAGSSQ